MIFFSLNDNKVKLETVIEGDRKAPFSIPTTPRCRGGPYSFPWIAPLYALCCSMLRKDVSSTILKVFGITLSRIEPRSPELLANTQPIRPTKIFFLFYPSHCDRGLIIFIVYYFQIWNKEEHTITISRVISCHMGPMYTETIYIYIYIYKLRENTPYVLLVKVEFERQFRIDFLPKEIFRYVICR